MYIHCLYSTKYSKCGLAKLMASQTGKVGKHNNRTALRPGGGGGGSLHVIKESIKGFRKIEEPWLKGI